MIGILNLIIIAGFIAIFYGYIVGKQIISANPGNSKMIEIASAIQEGARAYLNRQYKTIAIVGIIILVIITYSLGIWVGLGYFMVFGGLPAYAKLFHMWLASIGIGIIIFILIDIKLGKVE